MGALAALSLAQKQNALFLLVQFAITLVLIHAFLPSQRALSKRGMFIGSFAGLVVFGLTYLAVSPWLWSDLSRLSEHWREFFVVGGIGGGDVS